MTFDPCKPVQTRDGREAGIYATDGEDDQPLHGWRRLNGGKVAGTWLHDGRWLGTAVPHPNDLVNVTLMRQTWIVCTRDGSVFSRHSETDAEAMASRLPGSIVKFLEWGIGS
jgi:hypothetical protein